MRLPYLLLFTLFLAACNSQTLPTLTPFIPTDTPQGPIVPTRVTPTPSPTEEPTITPSPTSTDEATATATHTATATLTSSPEPTVTPSATSTPTAIPSETAISYGQERSGMIDADNPLYRYQFSAAAGDIVTVNLNALSGNLDPLLRLVDSSGREIAQNDDAQNGTRDSALTNFTLEDAGDYTIIASRLGEESGTSEGEFTLTLAQITPITAGTPQTISFGEEVSGTIDNLNYETRYNFDASADDIITIDLLATSNGFDPFLILLNADGEEVATNDDRSPRVRDAQIADFTIPATGTYTIVATRYNGHEGQSTGTYTLSLSQDDTSDGE